MLLYTDVALGVSHQGWNIHSGFLKSKMYIEFIDPDLF
jgi:hypothetical protein